MTKRVLTWVNRHRVEAGMDPLETLPSGIIGGAAECPLAHALHDVFTDTDGEQLMVYPIGLEVVNEQWDTIRKINVPQYVSTAIKRFDAGQYPDLVEGAF